MIFVPIPTNTLGIHSNCRFFRDNVYRTHDRSDGRCIHPLLISDSNVFALLLPSISFNISNRNLHSRYRMQLLHKFDQEHFIAILIRNLPTTFSLLSSPSSTAFCIRDTMGIVFHDKPNESQRDRLQDWEEAVDFAQAGIVWCAASFSCARLCFCPALARHWNDITSAKLPTSLRKYKLPTSLQAKCVSKQGLPGQEPPARCDHVDRDASESSDEEDTFPPGSTSPVLSSSSPAASSSTISSCWSAATSTTRTTASVLTPPVLQCLAGGFTAPIRDMTNPLVLSFEDHHESEAIHPSDDCCTRQVFTLSSLETISGIVT